MKANRHRLIFWPLFLGAVVFFLSGTGTCEVLWPSVIDGIGAALFVLAAVYSSDRSRRGSRVLRAGVIGVSLVAAIIWFVTGSGPELILTALFLLAVFSLLLAEPVRGILRKRALSGASRPD